MKEIKEMKDKLDFKKYTPNLVLEEARTILHSHKDKSIVNAEEEKLFEEAKKEWRSLK